VNVVADDGTVMDAKFSIEERPFSLVYESAGGKTGVNARNRDYRTGLLLILRRLATAGTVIAEVRVDSVVTRRLSRDEQRVELRRHPAPVVLAEVSDFDDLRRDISTAARAPGAREGSSRGGSSRRLRFELTPGHWNAAELERMVSGGGAVPDVDAVREVVQVAAGRVLGRTQGFLLSPAVKRAVELHAMGRAIAYYSREWDVEDVSADHSYDLECRRAQSVLYVEVKGSTSTGEVVIVTRNEVRHARSHHPDTELFIVSRIAVSHPETEPLASGGVEHRHPGWMADDSRLEAIGFEYTVPTTDRL
jgi:Domain of unknown function (DUF3883)